MRIQVQRRNVDDEELIKAFSYYISHEKLVEGVIERLQKSGEPPDEIPERYMREIVRKLKKLFADLRRKLSRNVGTWFTDASKMPRRVFRGKYGTTKPPYLTSAQIEDLRRLIESHFNVFIGIGVNVPDEVLMRWLNMGIDIPQENAEPLIDQSYVAGRLADTMTNATTYAEMAKLAAKFVPSRTDELIAQAARENAAKYIRGYGRKLADLAEDMLVANHKSALNDIVSRYFSGDLTHTTYNKEGFTPQEAEALLSTDKSVKGWRELATELKSRFKAVDVGRDWDRIAVTETRFAANLGRLQAIREESAQAEIYYHVQKTACGHCKRLYLEVDGVTPKRFPISRILANVAETGGMNVGRKASLPEGDGGYLPNAVVHPNCQCYPLKRVPDYPMVSPNAEGGMADGRGEEAGTGIDQE